LSRDLGYLYKRGYGGKKTSEKIFFHREEGFWWRLNPRKKNYRTSPRGGHKTRKRERKTWKAQRR